MNASGPSENYDEDGIANLPKIALDMTIDYADNAPSALHCHMDEPCQPLPSEIRMIVTKPQIREFRPKRVMSLPPAADQPDAAEPLIEFSIVIPCLNEANTLGRVIRKAQRSLERAGIRGEVIVADNGSTDGSQAIAQDLGAQVIAVERKGYGAALRGGFAAARGRYIIMGDADDSYDFEALDPFFEKLREGHHLVMGTRLKGEIIDNAMRPLHRWLGNPVITFLGNLFFRSGVSDFCCGLRGFDRAAIERIGLKTFGMETALEIIIKSSLNGLSIAEVPIKFYPDGRGRLPHLKTWRDGWKHFKFLILLAPLWAFFIPALVGAAIGVASLLLGATSLAGLLVGTGALLMSAQLTIGGILAHMIAVKTELVPPTPAFAWLRQYKLRHGLFGGSALVVIGTLLVAGSGGVGQAVGVLAIGLGITWMIASALITLLNFDITFK
jgi:glycosyltransferase involved in cell wall biosynthesis